MKGDGANQGPEPARGPNSTGNDCADRSDWDIRKKDYREMADSLTVEAL
jgi:hypothetical protein